VSWWATIWKLTCRIYIHVQLKDTTNNHSTSTFISMAILQVNLDQPVPIGFLPEKNFWEWNGIAFNGQMPFILLLLLQPFYGPLDIVRNYPGKLSPKRQNQKSKTNLNLLDQEIVSGSGISWAIQYANLHLVPDITTPAFHYSVFYRPDTLPATQPTPYKTNIFEAKSVHCTG